MSVGRGPLLLQLLLDVHRLSVDDVFDIVFVDKCNVVTQINQFYLCATHFFFSFILIIYFVSGNTIKTISKIGCKDRSMAS